jgi:hypothetical protein
MLTISSMTRKDKSLTMAMILLILVLIAIGLSSCGASWHLKRAEQHLKKAEMKGAKVDADTVWQTLTIPVPSVRLDTIIQSLEGDTVYLEKDRLKLKYVALPKDSIYIYGECMADTVYFDNPTTVYREIRAGMTTWETIILCIAVGAVALGIGYVIKSRRG